MAILRVGHFDDPYPLIVGDAQRQNEQLLPAGLDRELEGRHAVLFGGVDNPDRGRGQSRSNVDLDRPASLPSK
jgi:hypothetical protein